MTQRKFLKKLYQISEKFSLSRDFPRLLCIDYIEKSKLEDLSNNIRSNFKNSEQNENEEIKKGFSLNNQKTLSEVLESNNKSNFVTCIRPMCEFDEGWHLSNRCVPLNDFQQVYCSYLARLVNIVKNGNLSNQLKIFLNDQGRKLIEEIENKSTNTENDFLDSYQSFCKCFIDKIENNNVLLSDLSENVEIDDQNEQLYGLERCELKNGKSVWLCKNHIISTNAKVVKDLKMTIKTNDRLTNQMLKDIEEIKIDII